MIRRHATTVAVCAVCTISVMAHGWIARQSARRLERMMTSTFDDIPIIVEEWSPEELPLVDPKRPVESAPPRLLAAAMFEQESNSSIDEDRPVDALKNRLKNSSSTPQIEAKPLTPRRQQELLAVREVIEEEMPETSAEERDIWFEELKSLPAEVVRDLLQVRKQLRVLTPDHHLSGPAQLSHGQLGQPHAEREISASPVMQSGPAWNEDWTSTRAALEQAIAWSTHNLANAATPGYKRVEVLLGDVYDQNDLDMMPSSARGCGIKSLRLDVKQGKFETSEHALDLAIHGDGFFVLTDSATQQVYFTRCGQLTRTADCALAWRHADRELEIQPRIDIPLEATSINFQPDGTIVVLLPGQEEAIQIGQLELARFVDPSRLVPVGHGLYAAPPELKPHRAVPDSPKMGSIQQHAVEESNVDIEREQTHREFLQSLLKALPFASPPRTARETSRSPN